MAASIMLNLSRNFFRKQIRIYSILEKTNIGWMTKLRGCSPINSFKEMSSIEAIQHKESQTLQKPGNTINTEKTFSFQEVDNLLEQMESDQPLPNMSNPYKPEIRRCILCKYNVHIDYKNIQLLSQFVSPYTGRIYGRHITGLCIPMQKHIARLIKRARVLAFMPYLHKDLAYYEDPKLFDSSRR